MNYISVDEIKATIDEIIHNIFVCRQILWDLEEKITEIESANESFKNINGLKLVNRKSIMELLLKMKFVYINDSSVDVDCASIKEDIEATNNRLSSILNGISEAESSIEVIAIYLILIQKQLAKDHASNPEIEINVPFGDRMQQARILMEGDAMDGYNLLHSTPILMNGDVNIQIGQTGDNPNRVYSGRYLQFYNEYGIEVIAPMAYIALDAYRAYTDEELNENIPIYTEYYNRIMDNINGYRDFHRDALRENLGQIILEDSYYRDSNGNLIKRDNAGNTRSYIPSENREAIINMPIRPLLDNPNDSSMWQYQADTFTHETGHVLDNYLAKLQYQQGNNQNNARLYSNSDENYMMYYNVLEETDTINNADNLYDVGGLRGYAFVDPAENFAESVAEYYGDGIGTIAHYSPDDLRATRIHVVNDSGDKVMSLYEVFDNILNGRGFYGAWA